MAKVELKQPIVEEISGYLKDAQSVVLVDYRGLPDTFSLNGTNPGSQYMDGTGTFPQCCF